MEARQRDFTEACLAFQQARKHLGEDKSPDWFNDVARWIIEYEKDMTSVERKLALEYATIAAKRATAMAKEIAAEQAQAKDGQGDGDGMCQVDTAKLPAPYLDTLALAYHVNRKKDKAIAAAQKCVKMDDTEAYQKTLAKVRAGHGKEK